MPLPTPLLRKNARAHKGTFGHALIIAGSPRMLGASALTSLAAMRSGAGLVTAAVPKSLNLTLQKKISNVIMTWPLAETSQMTFSSRAFSEIAKSWHKYNAVAIGPGLTTNSSTATLVKKIITACPIPLVIDADALNVLATDITCLKKRKYPTILTPHPGEMARLIKRSRKYVEENRTEAVQHFVKKFNCTLVLKGHETLVAQLNHPIYKNKTGNVGMATAGSGDVLTGIITSFLAQGIDPFTAAKTAVFIHGKAGDLAAKKVGETSLIASDIINRIFIIKK